jgi:hypothetical protein
LIGFVPNQYHSREICCDHISASVGGVVIHYDNFKSDAARMLVDRRKTIAQQAPGVITGDNDRKIE